jgi:hypothetical protein
MHRDTDGTDRDRIASDFANPGVDLIASFVSRCAKRSTNFVQSSLAEGRVLDLFPDIV